jgi:SlyX protein
MSNDSVDLRLARAEERIAWLERHVTAQDRVMLDLSRDLDRLRAELKLLGGRATLAPAGEDALPAASEERPPHY